jgi:hypothetical protein
MLTLDDVKKAIDELEKNSRLTGQTCEQLVWLYFLKDKMGRSQETAPVVQANVQAKVRAMAPVTANQTGKGDYLTQELAEAWTAHMENTDGTTGPHWTLEQSKHVQAQRNIPGDPVAFWAVLDSIYSDYGAVARKYGVDSVNFYADMAAAWLEDADANPDKAGLYYRHIVKH